MIRKQGISLVALIVTIIVMTILAGAIIVTLDNSNIIKEAHHIVDETNLKEVKQVAKNIWVNAYATGSRTQEELELEVIKGLREINKIDLKDYEVTVTEQGVDVIAATPVPEEWSANVVAIVNGVPIPKGFVASQAVSENEKNSGLVIYEGEQPVTDDNVETARRTRNQYVWVPVDKENFITEFVRQPYNTTSKNISNTLGSYFWEVTLDTSTNMPLQEQSTDYVSDATRIEASQMYASVREYGGFYIARYEAGIDAQRTTNDGVLETNVYSIMGKIPYTYIPWSNSTTMNIDTGGAVEVARKLYQQTNTNYGVISTLVYGVQWDTVLQWWLKTGAVTDVLTKGDYGNLVDNVINLPSSLNDSSKVNINPWGSEGYKDKNSADIVYPKQSGTRWLLTTGALKFASVNNIYDMLGNVYEYTMEGGGIDQRVARGDNFYGSDDGVGRPVSYRSIRTTTDNSYSRGFRTSLYIKIDS